MGFQEVFNWPNFVSIDEMVAEKTDCSAIHSLLDDIGVFGFHLNEHVFCVSSQIALNSVGLHGLQSLRSGRRVEESRCCVLCNMLEGVRLLYKALRWVNHGGGRPRNCRWVNVH